MNSSFDANRTVGKSTPSIQTQYWAAAFFFLLTLLGSHIATPIYPTWQREFNLSTASITLIFACYPLGVTAGLLYGGRFGDQFGRKPLMLAGIVLTTVSSLTYLAATGMGYLVAARLINGVAVGLMSGPALAAVVELHPTGDRADASRVGAMVTLASPAIGLMMSTLVVYLSTSPEMLVTVPFFLQLCGLTVGYALLFLVRETILPHNRRTFRTASYRPQGVSVPAEVRFPFLLAAVTGVLCWANTGLWLSLGPAMVYDVIKSDNKLLGGLTVIGFLATAGIVQLFAKNVRYNAAIVTCLLLVIPSLILVNLTLEYGSIPGLAIGAIIAGASQGLGWMGCSELVNKIAPPDIRASVLSALYICGYFGTAIPVIITGIAADAFGLQAAIGGLSAIFVAVAVWLLWIRRRALASLT